MPQALGGVARAFGVGGEAPHVLGPGRAHDVELDAHLLEEGRRIVDVVLLSVAKGGSDIR